MVKISFGLACSLAACTSGHLHSQQESGALLQIGNRADAIEGVRADTSEVVRPAWLISGSSDSAEVAESAQVQKAASKEDDKETEEDEGEEEVKTATLAEMAESVAATSRTRAQAYAGVENAFQEAAELREKAKAAQARANAADEAALQAEKEAKKREQEQRALLTQEEVEEEESAHAFKAFTDAEAAVTTATEAKVQAFRIWDSARKKSAEAQRKAQAAHARAESAFQAEKQALYLLNQGATQLTTRTLLEEENRLDDSGETLLAEFDKLVETAVQNQMMESQTSIEDENNNVDEKDDANKVDADEKDDAEEQDDADDAPDKQKPPRPRREIPPARQFRLLQDAAAETVQAQMTAFTKWEEAALKAMKSSQRATDAGARAAAAEKEAREKQAQAHRISDGEKEKLKTWKAHEAKELFTGRTSIKEIEEAVQAAIDSKVHAYAAWNQAAAVAKRDFDESHVLREEAALAAKLAMDARSQANNKGKEFWDSLMSMGVLPMQDPKKQPLVQKQNNEAKEDAAVDTAASKENAPSDKLMAKLRTAKETDKQVQGKSQKP